MFLLYITISRPQPLNCCSVCLHYTSLKHLEVNSSCDTLHYGYTTKCFQNGKHFRSIGNFRSYPDLFRASLKGGVRKGGGFPTRVRGTMSACGVRRDIVPSCKCDYPPLGRGVSKCAQHLLDGTVEVRRGQSVIVPSSPEARDCHFTLVSVPLVSSCPIVSSGALDVEVLGGVCPYTQSSSWKVRPVVEVGWENTVLVRILATDKGLCAFAACRVQNHQPVTKSSFSDCISLERYHLPKHLAFLV